MLRYIMIVVMLATASKVCAGDSIVHHKQQFFKSLINKAYKIVKAFNDTDDDYIEPQHYNFAVMIQNTNTFEIYDLGFDKGQTIKFSSEPSVKLGPYFGWRWFFLGYTFDVKKMNISDGKKEFDLSLYSSLIGIDLFYRKSGKSCRIDKISLNNDIDTKALRNINFSGLESSVKGFNIYYIFNHKKFSYPAAFSQSTCQKRSCGSPIAGIGYTQHSLSLDYHKLADVIQEHLPDKVVELDESFKFKKIKYTDFSVSGGYAYNWVFAKNFLFCASLSAALAYNHSTGDVVKSDDKYRNFSLSNFNLDGIGRFGLVWNNTKWYCGVSSIFHTYNYRHRHFSSRNTFGTVNVYLGFNFDRK